MITLVFYLFSFLLITSALMVISLKNPVHSVLFLIFSFFNVAALFILLGAEFVAMTLVIVYVGAVAILFLFVVMMLDINTAEIKNGFLKNAPLGLFLGAIIFVELYIALTKSVNFLPKFVSNVSVPQLTNTEQLGMILYTNYFIVFQLAGIILLVAMIGAIVLTLTHNLDSRRQSITKQIMRDSKKTISLVNAETGKGVKV